jgi:hypothetical protein
MPSHSGRPADSTCPDVRPASTGGVNRRTVLHSIGAVGGVCLTAGCATLGDGSTDDGSVDGGRHQVGASQVHLHNDSDVRQRVEIDVTRRTEPPTTAVDRSLSLAPGEVVRLPEGRNVPLGDDVAVVVDVEAGPRERFEWTDPSASQAPLHVFVDGTGNVLFALQVG